MLTIRRLIATAWLSLPLLFSVTSSAKTEEPLPVTQESVHKFVEIALNDLTQTKGDSPLKTELAQLQKNIDHQLDDNIQSDIDDSKHFSPDLTHYIQEGTRKTSEEQRLDHLRHCIICNRVIHFLFENIRVQVPLFEPPFSAVYLSNGRGAAWFRVDPTTGYLYRILDRSGAISLVSEGRLVQQNGEWWATNGWVWFGPIKQWRQ